MYSKVYKISINSYHICAGAVRETMNSSTGTCVVSFFFFFFAVYNRLGNSKIKIVNIFNARGTQVDHCSVVYVTVAGI